MKKLVCLLSEVLILAGLAAAQESRGTIAGRVKDAQGAVIPGAVVVVTNQDTKVAVSLTTNDSGYYEAVLLNPGPYQVTAEMAGFKKLVRSGITLQAADRRDIELIMDVGALTETVQVSAEAPLIDVSRTDSGRTLDAQSVASLPAMANTVLTMIRFTPGVAAGVPTALLGPHSTQGAATDYSTGTGVGGNTWSIDGAVSDGSGRFATNVPNVDAVAETKVLTTTFDGSFGHSTGLGIAVVTKSGTNDFHGNASNSYWNQRWQGASFFAKQNYYRNIASLNAAGNTTAAAEAASRPIQPAGHSNMYNFNATGPLRIPKLFDFRNRVFWTLGFNGQRDQKPEETSTYNRIVPTEQNRRGDFSDLTAVTTNPGNFQLFDPYSTTADPARPGHYFRTAIPGNILPASYMALGQKFYDNYVKYFPLPNNWFDKTRAPDTNNYLSIDAPYNWKYDQWSGRLDVNLGKLRAFGRYTQNTFTEIRGDWTANIAPGLSSGNGGTGGGSGTTGVSRDDQNGVIDLAYTLSPTTMLHSSFSISNWSSRGSQGDYSYQFKPSDVGLPSYLDARCGNWCYLPQMGVAGYSTIGITGTAGPTYNRFDTWIADAYKTHGNHTFQAGLDFRRQIRSTQPGNNNGTYTFGNNYFRRFDDNGGIGYTPANIGLSWASFMMGMPTGITISDNESSYFNNPYYAWFVQDRWRVTPKLTVTLSLRHETELGARERFGRYIVDYDPNAKLPISDAVEAAYSRIVGSYTAGAPIPYTAPSTFPIRGAAVFANDPNAPKRAWGSAYMWLPRIGIGYQLDAKTVVRGGYGIYYDTTNVNVGFTANQNFYSKSTNPIISTAGASAIPVFDRAFSPDGNFPRVSMLNDPFPVRQDGTRFDAPLRDALGGMTTVGGGWTYPNNQIHARQQRWRGSIERQIGSHDVVEATYEGTFTSNLSYNRPANLGVPSEFYNFTQTRYDVNANWLNASINSNPFYGMTTAGTVPTNANAIYPDSVRNDTKLWTWMATNTLFTGTARSRAAVLFSAPNGNVNVPEPRFYSRSHMLSFSYNHRFHRGLTANAGYTWMQNKAGNGYFQGWHPDDARLPQSPFWNPIAGGQPQRITGTAVYDLPFGKGRAYLQNKWLDLVVGGWRISGVFQRQLGGLLGFGNNFFYGDPNSIKIDNPTISQYFNTAGCATGTAACTSGFEQRSNFAPGNFQYRTFPNNIDGLRGPGYTSIDGSLARTIRIRERLTFDARLDVLNVTNTSFLSGPNTTPTASTFGQITSQNQSPNRFLQIKGNLRW